MSGGIAGGEDLKTDPRSLLSTPILLEKCEHTRRMSAGYMSAVYHPCSTGTCTSTFTCAHAYCMLYAV
eukprot:scaffold125424_cov49-Phaeocystis_antarctica.AAC.1